MGNGEWGMEMGIYLMEWFNSFLFENTLIICRFLLGIYRR
jgi:hypothetical protein